jgi:cytochrome bd ubiquinol oxidase subunit II
LVQRPVLAIFPIIGAVGCGSIIFGLGSKLDSLPFRGTVLLFVAAYGTLAVSFLPYMVPFTITYTDAAAPPASLSFLFWFAGIIVLPLTLLYTVISYSVFRGKVKEEAEHY